MLDGIDVRLVVVLIRLSVLKCLRLGEKTHFWRKHYALGEKQLRSVSSGRLVGHSEIASPQPPRRPGRGPHLKIPWAPRLLRSWAEQHHLQRELSVPCSLISDL